MVDSQLSGYTIAKIYKLQKKIGSGAFGDIYLGINKNTQEEYAIKVERIDTKNPQIYFESKLYSYLNNDSNKDHGIPRVHQVGSDPAYNFLIMDLLGKSLEDLFIEQNKRFSLKTVLILADQMISRIEFMHIKNFLHRDLKPDNFLMGHAKKQNRVYLIDFGLAKRYMKDGKHIPYSENKSLTGTARYASVNTHIGIEQGRRDDLESLAYIWMYFLRGSLPWMNQRSTNKKDKYERIMEIKMQTSIEVLCKGFPQQFVQYLQYVKNLRFEDKPDYVYLRQLFKDVMKQNNYENDYLYDWSRQASKPPIPNITLLENKVNELLQQKIQKTATNQDKPPMHPDDYKYKIKPQSDIKIKNSNQTHNSMKNDNNSSQNRLTQRKISNNSLEKTQKRNTYGRNYYNSADRRPNNTNNRNNSGGRLPYLNQKNAINNMMGSNPIIAVHKR